jgi:hypothetical protein
VWGRCYGVTALAAEGEELPGCWFLEVEFGRDLIGDVGLGYIGMLGGRRMCRDEVPEFCVRIPRSTDLCTYMYFANLSWGDVNITKITVSIIPSYNLAPRVYHNKGTKYMCSSQ